MKDWPFFLPWGGKSTSLCNVFGISNYICAISHGMEEVWIYLYPSLPWLHNKRTNMQQCMTRRSSSKSLLALSKSGKTLNKLFHPSTIISSTKAGKIGIRLIYDNGFRIFVSCGSIVFCSIALWCNHRIVRAECIWNTTTIPATSILWWFLHIPLPFFLELFFPLHIIQAPARKAESSCGP